MNNLPLTKSKIFSLLKKIKTRELKNEKIELINSKNRILSMNIKSLINLPPFNNSAVDGYAILKKDIKKVKKFKCSKKIKAGDSFSPKIRSGELIRIFTGAVMPKNSNTVIMQENVSKKGNFIKINKVPEKGQNCRIAGEDVTKGKIILSKGDKINSVNINLVAAIGKERIVVKEKLKVGFYTSGNELKKPTEKLKGSEINNSNYFSLKILLEEEYLKSKYLGILKDSKAKIKKSFIKNISSFDVIITTGGASVGDEDHIVSIIKELGNIIFWKTAIKPGRPLAIGKIKKTIFICLPGNPVSVHLLYGMIVKPYLEFLCGSKFQIPSSTIAKVNFSMKKKSKRLEWIRVNIINDSKELIVNKYPKQGSGMITSLSYSDGIIEIPENISQINVGDTFPFYSFKNLFN